MTKLATLLSDFLQQHLPNERGCSQHTVQSYTDSFRLLVRFAAKQHRIRPCQLKIEQLSAALVYAAATDGRTTGCCGNSSSATASGYTPW